VTPAVKLLQASYRLYSRVMGRVISTVSRSSLQNLRNPGSILLSTQKKKDPNPDNL